MKLYQRQFLLKLLRFFLKELIYLSTNDILSIGKYKFFSQYIKSKLYGRRGLYSLIPMESKVIDFEKLVIRGDLYNSNLLRSFISSKLYIQAINGIIIDSSVLIGPDVKIISANHSFNDYKNWDNSDPIKINKNVWIGANAVILPGVNIGENCIVGAGSIVTKSFEDNSVIGGNPARLIRKNSLLT